MSEIELTPLRPWETLEGRATQVRIARSQQTKARIISLERQLAEAKAILSDQPDHSDVDAAAFEANALRSQLAEKKGKLEEAQAALRALSWQEPDGTRHWCESAAQGESDVRVNDCNCDEARAILGESE